MLRILHKNNLITFRMYHVFINNEKETRKSNKDHLSRQGRSQTFNGGGGAKRGQH